jgi:aminopeptidase
VIVEYTAAVEPGELVTLEAPLPGVPLAVAIYRCLVRAGAHVTARATLDELREYLLVHGSDEQLDWVNPARVDEIETGDVRIAVDAPANTRYLAGARLDRLARWERATERLRNRYLERASTGGLRWVLASYPTEAAAQDAEMSLAQYEEFVCRAAFLDHPDPIASWRAFGEQIDRLAAVLATKSELRIVGEGTDLRLGVAGRTWIPAKGQENFPDGEVFTAPVETSVEGEIAFTYPAVFRGREVAGARLRFEGGEVVELGAAQGEDLLREMVALDEGARRAGEFAFGLNEAVTEFTKNVLFDEKIGGTVHLALGTAYPESGGLNRSALHWDLVCDLRRGSEVYADGELVYRDGRFLDGVV